MITTNLEFTEWTSIFGAKKMTAVLLDRLTNSDTINFLKSLENFTILKNPLSWIISPT
nr:ATP-binding protein [Neobacillus sp. MER 74]